MKSSLMFLVSSLFVTQSVFASGAFFDPNGPVTDGTVSMEQAKVPITDADGQAHGYTLSNEAVITLKGGPAERMWRSLPADSEIKSKDGKKGLRVGRSYKCKSSTSFFMNATITCEIKVQDLSSGTIQGN